MKSKNRIQELLKQTEKVADAHRQFYKVYFEDNSMDFAFQLALGTVRNGGGEIGEMFYTAAQIEDYNPDSWAEEWPRMAERVERKAKQAEADGHVVSAREFYIRASTYYRTALFALTPDNPGFLAVYYKSMTCFIKAATLLEPQIELIKIPFENTFLPGCFSKAETNAEKKKTIIAIGGGETFFTDLYLHLGPSANKRGYHFMTVDLPGQGILPMEGHFFRADSEIPLNAVVDYALSRPDVDGERLAVYGASGGGYYVPRAAAFDKRIKACVTNYAIIDIQRIMKEMAIQSDEVKMSPFNIRMFQLMAWRNGLSYDDMVGMIDLTKDFSVDPEKIHCPFLNVTSEGEYANPATQKMQDEFFMLVRNIEKKMIVTAFEDGAGAHCLGENTGLLSALVFDWLDEIFQEVSVL
ncbi:alpha/beta hydrolase family protein [Anaerocolumna sp. MB42-C2]|uniref:alpha/beta hydrolase family protein n=1 Tax=Anaerocolumna sp. MB42-C2 TaxID=3070997 RepID=UPI0027E2068C|nr:alpha/beta hydrolase [Anaerocolumna sp. MB42-C2]WMJ89179.1 alpha/beta hydrolase [Anaerocolumna sp. MB42-C2]